MPLRIEKFWPVKFPKAGADFVKTSTGFSAGSATVEDGFDSWIWYGR